VRKSGWLARSPVSRIPVNTRENIAAKLDGPMTFGYGIDAVDAALKN
jgi:hypothetical protein